MKNYLTNYRITIYIVIIGLTVCFYSCSNLVDVEMPNDKIEKSEVYNDIATTKSALNNLYLKFATSSVFNKFSTGASFNLSLFTDELDFYGTADNSAKDIYENNISDIHVSTTSWWNNSYQNIYAINDFIIGVSNSHAFDDNQKKHLLGEAYTLRALYYQYLTMLYGSIPYTVSTDYTINKTLKKISHEEVLLKVEDDLNKAMELLDYSYRDKNKFYINKSVTQIILLENFILQKKYDKAEILANFILSQNLYNIEDDLSKTFKKDAKSTIWQIAPQYTSDSTNEATLYLFSNFTVNSPTLATNLVNLFTEGDKRKAHWLKEFNTDNQKFYQVYKYKNKVNNTDEFSILFRIEQVYFQLAYSLSMQENTKKAIEILNQIRQKRGLNNLPITLSKSEFITVFLNESTKEFFTENARRYFDLKITNQLDILKTTKPNFKSFHNLLPIPFRQLEINKNLMPNNPGY